MLPILIEGDHAHGLVTSDLWYNEGIDVVPHARGVCGRDEELCHCLLSVTVWNTCYAVNQRKLRVSARHSVINDAEDPVPCGVSTMTACHQQNVRANRDVHCS